MVDTVRYCRDRNLLDPLYVFSESNFKEQLQEEIKKKSERNDNRIFSNNNFKVDLQIEIIKRSLKENNRIYSENYFKEELQRAIIKRNLNKEQKMNKELKDATIALNDFTRAIKNKIMINNHLNKLKKKNKEYDINKSNKFVLNNNYFTNLITKKNKKNNLLCRPITNCNKEIENKLDCIIC
tara:strand:+ start:1626 stop:2171 length:546 start_codon:yes stop_codon:yes gene_type:complete